MINHKLYQIWNKVPVTYYQEGVKKNFFQWLWHSHKIKLAKKLIKKLNFKKCVDIGCASGYMIAEIAKQYPDTEYYGIDIYDEAISFAKKAYPHIKFRVASADDLPFENDSFDLILFYETLEHVEFPLRSLKEIKRILKKDGTLILTMDSGNFLFRIVWFFWVRTKGRVWKEAHLHPFNHRELEELIKKAGFKTREKILSFLGMEVTFILYIK